MTDKPALILDNGTSSIKSGFAFDDHPRSIFSSVVGRPKYLNGRIGKEYYDVLIGEEASDKCEEFDLVRPMSEGRVRSWDDMERVWHHMFYRELRVAPEDGPLLMTCVPMCPLGDKEIICEIMFETLNVPSLYIESQSVLSLYACGRTTGVAVDSGYDVTHIVPVYEGNIIKSGHIKYNIAGKQISTHLAKMLNEKGYCFTSSWNDQKCIDDIKHSCCYVCKDFSCSLNISKYQKNFELPDGRVINIGEEAHFCTEPLFQPDLMGFDGLSLPQEINMSVIKCDAQIQEYLLLNLVLCGGNSMFPNFVERLVKETQKVIDDNYSANVIGSDERCVYPWLGGSILAGMSDSQQFWLPKKQYEEYGTKILKSKFI